MTTQLQQCREVAAALEEEVTEWRRKDAGWREHRNAAEKALHDMPFVMDNYRAALARAEAAEAEAAEARATNEALAELAASETERRVALAERVAELEAQLAAQGWRPVTEDWPPSNIIVPVQMRDGSIRWGHRYGDLWNLTGGRYSIGDVTHAYELPPAPQEPTP